MVRRRLGWEIVYTGFILILLCFFIMLCTFSTMEEAKVTRFVQSFVNTLSIMQGGMKRDAGDVIIPPSADMVDVESEMGQILQNLKTYSRDLGIENDITFESTEKGLMMRLSDHIIFDPGEAELSEAGNTFLNKVAALFSKTSHNVSIEGHTDNIPIQTKQFPSNWELSTLRAVNVLRFFSENGNYASSRLSAVGYGEHQPISPNDTPEQRAINRRVEIIFSKPPTSSI